jgi:ribulose-5-phosphate 4-epimerase/fuculose-1-phosphate aldolase
MRSELIEDLVAANRILADQGILDAWGHVSVRNPDDTQKYMLSRSVAPELVTGDDLVEYDSDSNPVESSSATGYLERFIHGEIYKARSDVNAIVHSHSPSVIPFGISDVPLRPVYHMSAFLWEGVPIFEIRNIAGMTDLMIRNAGTGPSTSGTAGKQRCSAYARPRGGRGGNGSPISRGPCHLHRDQCTNPEPGDKSWW